MKRDYKLIKIMILGLLCISLSSSLVYSIETSDRLNGWVFEHVNYKYVCFIANNITYKLNITHDVNNFNCDPNEITNSNIKITCDSRLDGNGDGTCHSGESCVNYEFHAGNYTAIQKNSMNTITETIINESNYMHYKYKDSSATKGGALFDLVVSQENGNKCESANIISTMPANNSYYNLQNITVTVNIGIPSTCRYSNSSGNDYINMTDFDETDSRTHKLAINGTDNTSYGFYIKCNSSTGAINQDDYYLTFIAEYGLPKVNFTSEIPDNIKSDSLKEFSVDFSDAGIGFSNSTKCEFCVSNDHNCNTEWSSNGVVTNYLEGQNKGNCSYYWNTSGYPDSYYTVAVRIADKANNTGNSLKILLLDRNPPIFTLTRTQFDYDNITLLSNSTNTSMRIDFYANMQDVNTITNCSLYINGTYIKTSASVRTNPPNYFITITYNFSLRYDATQYFNYSIECTDALGFRNMSQTKTFTIFIKNVTSQSNTAGNPLIFNLTRSVFKTTPSDNITLLSNMTDKSMRIDFYANMQDVNTITNCSLYVNETYIKTSTAIEVDPPRYNVIISYNFSIRYGTDQYFNWSIECTDALGFRNMSETKTFTIFIKNVTSQSNAAETFESYENITGSLTEGETQTYTLSGKDYEITNIIITDVAPIYAQFKVNGKVTTNMGYNSIYKLDNNTIIKIFNILSSEAGDVTGDRVEFAIINICQVPSSGLRIKRNTTLCKEEYNLSNGLEILKDDVVLNCNNAVLRGNNLNSAIKIYNNNVKVTNCTITNFAGGLLIYSSNNKITDNNIYLNKIVGIGLSSGSGNIVTKNLVALNGIGIQHTIANSNIIDNNNITQNTGCGIKLEYSSYKNTIRNNTLYNNSYNVCNYIRENTNLEKNYWGTTNISEIENKISDYYINSDYGIVNYCPYLNLSGNQNNTIIECATNSRLPYEISINSPKEETLGESSIMLNISTGNNATCIYNISENSCAFYLCRGTNKIMNKKMNITGVNIHLQNISVLNGFAYTIDVSCIQAINNTSNKSLKKKLDLYVTDNDEDSYNQFVDCNDRNEDINPSAIDIPENSIDENCDGKDAMKLIGNVSVITTAGIKNLLKLKINNSENITLNYTGSVPIKILDGSDLVIEFNHNFSRSTLNITFGFNKTSYNNKGAIVIKDLELQENETKTAYFDHLDNNLNTICIKDANIDSVNDISSACNAADELSLYCTSSGNSAVFNGSTYTCTDLGSQYKIEGLKHSGVVEYGFTSPPSNNNGGSSGGGGGGGGGSSALQCNDGKDNDGDELVDYNGNANAAKDLGCDSIYDSDETNSCIEKWECMPWFTCSKDGKQDRVCKDLNRCSTEKNKPNVVQECRYAPAAWEISKQDPKKEIQDQEAPKNTGELGEILIKDNVKWLWNGEKWLKEGTEEYKLAFSVMQELENNKTSKQKHENSITGTAVTLTKKTNPALGIMIIAVITSISVFVFLKTNQQKNKKKR